jgi:hypothetical protein
MFSKPDILFTYILESLIDLGYEPTLKGAASSQDIPFKRLKKDKLYLNVRIELAVICIDFDPGFQVSAAWYLGLLH